MWLWGGRKEGCFPSFCLFSALLSYLFVIHWYRVSTVFGWNALRGCLLFTTSLSNWNVFSIWHGNQTTHCRFLPYVVTDCTNWLTAQTLLGWSNSRYHWTGSGLHLSQTQICLTASCDPSSPLLRARLRVLPWPQVLNKCSSHPADI